MVLRPFAAITAVIAVLVTVLNFIVPWWVISYDPGIPNNEETRFAFPDGFDLGATFTMQQAWSPAIGVLAVATILIVAGALLKVGWAPIIRIIGALMIAGLAGGRILFHQDFLMRGINVPGLDSGFGWGAWLLLALGIAAVLSSLWSLKADDNDW